MCHLVITVSGFSFRCLLFVFVLLSLLECCQVAVETSLEGALKLGVNMEFLWGFPSLEFPLHVSTLSQFCILNHTGPHLKSCKGRNVISRSENQACRHGHRMAQDHSVIAKSCMTVVLWWNKPHNGVCSDVRLYSCGNESIHGKTTKPVVSFFSFVSLLLWN